MFSMPSPQELSRRLDDVSTYLGGFPPRQRSLHFEELVTQSVASLLQVSYFSSDKPRGRGCSGVMWYGSPTTARLAPQGQDGDAMSPELCLVIDASILTGTKQCTSEFPQCLRHTEDLARRRRSRDVVGLFVPQTLHVDTLRAIQASNHQRPVKIVPMEASLIACSLEAASLAFTMRHLEVRRLLKTLLACVEEAATVRAFRQDARRRVGEWKREVLRTEETTVVAVKSYEALTALLRARPGTLVSASEVLFRLENDPFVNEYFKQAGTKLRRELIRESLESESLAVVSPLLDADDFVLSPVSFWEYHFRSRRKLSRVREIARGD